LIGGRLGYVLFYDFSFFLSHPLRIIFPFEFSNGFHYVGISGMSYHGGVLGVLLATYLFCRKNNIGFWDWADLFCPAIPLGYTFGRIGNFINGELYGRVTSGVLGMYFPDDPTHQPRHPSQIYEALGEGALLFILLWSLRRRKALKGFFLPLYLVGYGVVRFGIEFTREPDPQLGFILGPLTMGQILCVGMIGAALLLIWMRRRAVKNP
jgi:phosphatidylglycerol:prolipoprotein diacylglycerol transferase